MRLLFVLNVKKTRINVEQREPVTSGSVNVYTVQFVFDEVWNGLVKTVVFRAGNCGSMYEVLLEGDTCQIPWEVFEDASVGKSLNIGVYGMQGDEIVLPTIWAGVGYIEQGVKEGESGQKPSPGIYQQILTQLDSLKDHNNIGHRDDPGQHPIEAISGFDEVTNEDIFNLWKGGSN